MMEASVNALAATGITTEIIDDLTHTSLDGVIGHPMRDSHPWYQLRYN